MNSLFVYPFAFAALAALPVLVAIYLLRNRFRQYYVSSLMLWGVQRRHKQGGLNLDRLQTPLLFILEFLVFLLLAFAAAGPLLRSKSDTRRLVIVLDDSFSMLAKTDTSCRNRAQDELTQYLKSSRPFQAAFIQAGLQPVVLADKVDNMAAVLLALDQWQCMSPSADLDKALAMAGQMADGKARILVISDHFLKGIAGDSQFESWAFGEPLSNTGFLHADRMRVDDRDRCILTIGNFSAATQTTRLKIQSAGDSTMLYEKDIDIAPSAPFQMIFEPPSDSDLVASISDDVLNTDNRIILLRPDSKKVRVAVDVQDEGLSESVRQAIDAIPSARQAAELSHLLITDRPVTKPTEPLQWTLHIMSDPNAAAFVGPFISDRNHPLTEGLDLQGVIWSAANQREFRSVPIISAGNTSLLEDESDRNNAHHLRLHLNHEVSTLQQSPNWPIFFWNLIHWRQQQLTGLHRSNWRLGSQVDFEVPHNCMSLRLLRPDGQQVSYDPTWREIIIPADIPGVYQITADADRYAFAVNAITAEESDLQNSCSGRLASPDQATQFWWEYWPYDWIFLLTGILLLMLHGFLIFKQSTGATV